MRYDSYTNLINQATGLGGSYDSLSSLQIRPPQQYNRRWLDNLYRRIWACRKVCSYKPNLMAKEWGHLVATDGNPETIETITEIITKSLRAKFRWGQTLANKDGGAVVIRLVDDGREMEEPIDLENTRSVEYTRVFDRWEVIPDPFSLQTNPFNPEFYTLWTNYGISGEQQNIVAKKIHHSRIIRFRGVPISPEAIQYNQGWEDSALVSFVEPCLRYFEAMGYVSASVRSFETMVFAIQNLFSKLDTDSEGEILRRLQLNQEQMSTLRGVVVDKDTEEMSLVSRTYTGISDILEQLRNEMVAASGLTKPQLLSEHPTGLAATGESERLAEAEAIKSDQIDKWQEQLEFDIQLQLKLNNVELNNWHWEWFSLFQLTNTEESEIYTRYAQSDSLYLSNGVLTPNEIRQSRFKSQKFNQTITLEEDTNELKQELAETMEVPANRLDGLSRAELLLIKNSLG